MWRPKIGFLVLLLIAASGMAFGQVTEKKLIQFGWDVKGISETAEKIGQWQDMPFDGITLSSKVCYTFYTKDVTEEEVAKDVEIMKSIKWGKFTDNFFKLYAADNVDWFDDALWSGDSFILRNAAWCARLARAGGCKGLMFDPEFNYWGRPHPPWKYEAQARKDEKSFAEFEQIVRKRGAQYMDTIEREFPNPVILTLFWGSMGALQKAASEPDLDKRRSLLQELNPYYSLLNAFMTGMLEGADPGTIIVDGNESSYYWNEPLHYYRSYHNIHQIAQQLIPPELRAKYRAQVQCGHAIYADYLCNTRSIHTSSTYLTPEERAKWVESNVYWALKTSDRYVWWYNEGLTFRKASGMVVEERNVEPGIAPAINSARRKVAEGKELGFEISDITKKGWRAYVHAENRPIEPNTARIHRLEGAAPTIDGLLDDAAWQKAALLGPFVNHLTARLKEMETSTTARMTYDDKHLYVAFRCDEPDVENLHSAKFHDESYPGPRDRVEIAIAVDEKPTAYHHIRLSPENQRWDSRTESGVEIYGKDSSWTGEYETATHKAKDCWYVEVAIPWATLGREVPEAGAKIKGNLIRRTRRRPATRLMEFMSWSLSRKDRYVEAQHFGTWVFE